MSTDEADVNNLEEENQREEDPADEEEQQEEEQQREEEQEDEDDSKPIKRKRSESDDGHVEVKKPKAENAEATNGDSSESIYYRTLQNTDSLMIIEIPPEKVGQIIGSKGMIIQDIQSRSGTHTVVNQNFPPGVWRQVEIRGTQVQINAAFDLIKRILEHGPTSIHANTMSGGPTITTTMDCNPAQVGKVIGSNGATIKDIQSKSGAKVQIDQNFPPDQPRKVQITGTANAVAMAVQLVQNIMNGLPPPTAAPVYSATPSYYSGAPRPSHPVPQPVHAYQPPVSHYGAPAAAPVQSEVQVVIDVPKAIVGKIIGKAGETVQSLQQKSGCHINVDQKVPEGYPCKVVIKGTPYNVDIARKLVEEIQMGVHTAKLGMTLPPPMSAPAQPAYQQPYQQPYSPPQQSAPYGYNPYQQPQQQPQPGHYGQYSQPAPQQPMASYAYTAPAAAPAASYMSHQPQQHQMHQQQRPVAAPVKPAPAPVASVWSEYKDDEGRSYWYNSATGTSQV